MTLKLGIDAQAEINRLTAELEAARADLAWMQNDRNKWQDCATQRHYRAEAAEAERDALIRAAIREVWGCCEELEDKAYAKLPVVTTDHEKGFWAAQKMTAKRIRRATQMPTTATAALDRLKAEAELTGWKRGRDDALAEITELRGVPSLTARAQAFDDCCDMLSASIRALTPPADLAARNATAKTGDA
ncbi:hypothetical protein [Pseudotabrizicola algicola]|uniref:Uncharacterized protein n=1 Tax=Pseudotabrizicola algicola TaxID=2709381 RepID=A0A6B3RGM9_9RHOB|nr:hypothetical protein [Pseudotabrizicola algicola]NEX45214.1 hypothetical protein [Pseudotabrizicola algicola]